MLALKVWPGKCAAVGFNVVYRREAIVVRLLQERCLALFDFVLFLVCADQLVREVAGDQVSAKCTPVMDDNRLPISTPADNFCVRAVVEALQ